jgi:DNA mismatch repair protein MutS
VQLDLFAPAPVQPPPTSAVEETLRAVDPNRLTPLDALQLVMKLRAMLDGAGR